MKSGKKENKYWDNFYRNFSVASPSSFAKFCLKYIKENEIIVDVGCGNGRDSYFFAKKGFFVVGIDNAVKPFNKDQTLFLRVDFKEYKFCDYTVYARFFLHSLTDNDIKTFLNKINGLVLLEFRNVGDKPVLYKNHFRNLVDGKDIRDQLIKRGFKILFFKIGRNLSKMKSENPLICRIIAEKKF